MTVMVFIYIMSYNIHPEVILSTLSSQSSVKFGKTSKKSVRSMQVGPLAHLGRGTWTSKSN